MLLRFLREIVCTFRSEILGFRVWGLDFEGYALESFYAQALNLAFLPSCRNETLGFRVFWFKVQGLGTRVGLRGD